MQLLNTNSTSYTKIDKLGEGSFGEVFIVKNIKNDKLFVCKEMKLHGLDEPTIMQLFTEVKVLQAVRHPNIIEMIESYKTKSNKLVLILEYASGGDLFEYIKNRKQKPIPQKQIETWVLQLLLSLKHSHDHKIIHRDLKTSNVFLDCDDNVKLGDFGLAKNLMFSSQKMGGMTGTPLSLAPETIEKGVCSYKSDVWALGIIVYELCCLKNPFYCTNYPLLLKKICCDEIPDIPDFYSRELNKFARSLLERDEGKRPSVAEIFESDFIRELLINNKSEFKKLVSMTTLSNIDLNDNSMKKDFAQMKVYRFSEYKDPANMIKKIEKMVKKNDKASRFKNRDNGVVVSESEEEEDVPVEESGVFTNTPMLDGIKNLDIQIDNISVDSFEEKKEEEESNDFGLLSDKEDSVQEEESNGFDLLSDKEEQSNGFGLLSNQNSSIIEEEKDRRTNFGLLSESEIQDNKEKKIFEDNSSLLSKEEQTGQKVKVSNLFNDSFNKDKDTKDKYVYNSAVDSLHGYKEEQTNTNGNRKEENHKPTISTQMYDSVVKKPVYTKPMPSRFNKENLLSSESDIEEPNKDPLTTSKLEQTKTITTKIKESREETSRFMKTSNYHLKSKPKNNCNKILAKDNHYFTQYKELSDKITKPGKAKFKIKRRSPTSINKYSVTTRSKKDNYNLKNTSYRKIDKNEFKLKLKTHNNIMNNKMNVIKINLNTLKDFSYPNKTSQRPKTRTVNINLLPEIRNKNNFSSSKSKKPRKKFSSVTITPVARKKINSLTSNVSRKSKKSPYNAKETSMGKFSSRVDEYGFFTMKKKITNSKVSTRKTTNSHVKKSQIKNRRSTRDGELHKIYRKSKIGQIRTRKDFFVKDYGKDFEVVFGTIKKFIMINGLKKVEKDISKEGVVVKGLKKFVKHDWNRFKGKRNIVELVRLCIMELRCELL